MKKEELYLLLEGSIMIRVSAWMRMELPFLNIEVLVLNVFVAFE